MGPIKGRSVARRKGIVRSEASRREIDYQILRRCGRDEGEQNSIPNRSPHTDGDREKREKGRMKVTKKSVKVV